MRRDESSGQGSPGRQSKGPVAFHVFYERELVGVLSLTLALTRSESEAEDATQEAFLRAYRDWSRVSLLERPEAWVRRVALNTAISRFRRLKAEARALGRLDAVSTDPVSLFDSVGLEFWKAVQKLPKRQAQVVALTYYSCNYCTGRTCGDNCCSAAGWCTNPACDVSSYYWYACQEVNPGPNCYTRRYRCVTCQDSSGGCDCVKYQGSCSWCDHCGPQ